MPWNYRSAQKGKATLYELNVVGLRERKKAILQAANAENATDKEKALLLAIASIETEKMLVDYPAGDGKSNDAYNVSIYKMNVGMIKQINPNADYQLIHKDITEATNILLQGLRMWGKNKLLRFHRGGEGAFSGQVPDTQVTPYIQAVEKIEILYAKNKWQLAPNTTDDIRYTIHVDPI